MLQTHKRTGLRWHTFRYIEGILRDLNNYPILIKSRENEVIAPFRVQDENIGGGKSSMISNATERIATALVTDEILVRLQSEYEAVYCSLSEIPQEKRRVIELAYLTRPRVKTWQGIAMECNYSVSQCYRIRNKLILEIARKLGMR